MVGANINTVEAIGLVGSVVSIALAIFAIWQASTFYRWSDTASKESKDSARDIAAAVERIEKIFDTFYSDTFGLMKDTYADIRKHTWQGNKRDDSEEEDLGSLAEKAAAEKIEELRQELQGDLERLTKHGETTGAEVEGLRQEFKSLLNRAIDQSRKVEAEAEGSTLRLAIMKRVEELEERNQKRIPARLFARPIMREGFAASKVFKELRTLQDEGEIDFEIDTEREPGRLPEARAQITFNF